MATRRVLCEVRGERVTGRGCGGQMSRAGPSSLPLPESRKPPRAHGHPVLSPLRKKEELYFVLLRFKSKKRRQNDISRNALEPPS